MRGGGTLWCPPEGPRSLVPSCRPCARDGGPRRCPSSPRSSPSDLFLPQLCQRQYPVHQFTPLLCSSSCLELLTSSPGDESAQNQSDTNKLFLLFQLRITAHHLEFRSQVAVFATPTRSVSGSGYGGAAQNHQILGRNVRLSTWPSPLLPSAAAVAKQPLRRGGRGQ